MLTAQIALPAARYPDAAGVPRVLGAAARAVARDSRRDRGGGDDRTCRSTATSAPAPTRSSAARRAAGRGRAARTPGSRRRRLLQGDAHPAARGPCLQRRRHAPTAPPVVHHRRISWRRSTSPAASADRPADPARRPDEPDVHDRRRRRHDQQRSISASRSRRSGSTIRVAQQAPARHGAGPQDRGSTRRRSSPQVRAAVRAIDPEQPIADVRTMEQWMARSLQNAARADMMLLAHVRRRGAGAVGDRHLRRARVRRGAARARVRHPPGARRRPLVDPVARAAARVCGPPAPGIALGLAGVARAGAVPADAAVRRHAARSARLRGCRDRCCSRSRWPPATSPPVARPGSIRWSRCATRRAHDS